MSNEKKEIPIGEGLWRMSPTNNNEVRLIGEKCSKCDEIFFPKKMNGICTYCQSKQLKEIELSNRGKIYNFTVVMQRSPEFYHGPVPYAFGFVELPDKIRIRSHFTGCNLDQLKIGMDVRLVIEKMHENTDGNDVMAYMFKPTSLP